MGSYRRYLLVIPVALIVLLDVALYVKAPFLSEQLFMSPADARNERVIATPPRSDAEERRAIFLGFDDYARIVQPSLQ
jgi:hypothetical protein